MCVKVTAAVIEKDGKILIAKRKEGGRLASKWEFPGGKLEEGETPKECLRRELREEFGIDTRIKDFICSSEHEYSYGSIELLAYRADHLSGEFRLNDHEEIRWIKPNEFDEYDFAEADLPVVCKLKEIFNILI